MSEDYLKIREKVKEVMSEQEIVAIEETLNFVFESIKKMIEPVWDFANELATKECKIAELLYKKGIFNEDDLKTFTEAKWEENN